MHLFSLFRIFRYFVFRSDHMKKEKRKAVIVNVPALGVLRNRMVVVIQLLHPAKGRGPLDSPAAHSALRFSRAKTKGKAT